jgi:hypothetical protein
MDAVAEGIRIAPNPAKNNPQNREKNSLQTRKKTVS